MWLLGTYEFWEWTGSMDTVPIRKLLIDMIGPCVSLFSCFHGATHGRWLLPCSEFLPHLISRSWLKWCNHNDAQPWTSVFFGKSVLEIYRMLEWTYTWITKIPTCQCHPCPDKNPPRGWIWKAFSLCGWPCDASGNLWLGHYWRFSCCGAWEHCGGQCWEDIWHLNHLVKKMTETALKGLMLFVWYVWMLQLNLGISSRIVPEV